MPKLNILVTCPPMIRSMSRYSELLADAEFEVECPDIQQVLSEDELIRTVGDYHGWIIGDDPATERVFAAGVRGNLRGVVKWGVGTDNVDFAGAAAVGLTVTHTPNMFGDEVADVALGYVIGLARETFAISEGVHRGEWPKPVGISLKDKAVAVVGFGDIGRAVVDRLLACKMKVQVYEPDRVRWRAANNVVFKIWPEDLDQADFVVLCCSLCVENRHLIDTALLAQCKQGVRIVNVSRGALIDESALSIALESGRVHSAALEVFDTEPLPENSPLRTHANCLFGSHNASNTREAVDRTSRRAIQLLRQALNTSRSAAE